MKLKLATFAITVMAFTSCKKNNDDPSPNNNVSGSDSNHFRISSLNQKSPGENNTSTYTYNSDGRLVQILSLDSVNTQVNKTTYQYNTNGLVSFTSYVGDNYESSSSYIYSSDNLLETYKHYTDAAGTNLQVTSVYHYNTAKELKYKLTTNASGPSVYVDSTVYTDYANGRPGIIRSYSKSGSSSYSFNKKNVLTYDARMNHIKTESNSTYGDSTIDYVSYEKTFVNLLAQQTAVWKELSDNFNDYIDNANDLSPGTKDVDTDFETETIQAYSNCGISSKYNTSILEVNTLGYPIKLRDVFASYNCGTLNNTTTSTTTINYEPR